MEIFLSALVLGLFVFALVLIFQRKKGGDQASQNVLTELQHVRDEVIRLSNDSRLEMQNRLDRVP